MAKENYYYDTRNNKVYTSEELINLDNSTKRFIKMVPSDGVILNGQYVRLNSIEKKYQEETDKIIDIVNKHHDEVYTNKTKQEPGNFEDADLYVYNAVFDLTQELEMNDNYSIDELRVKAIQEIKKDIRNDKYEYLSTDDIQKAFEKSKNGKPVRAEYKKEKIKKMIISAAVTTLAIATIIGTVKLKNEISDAISVDKATISISQLSYDENDTKYVQSAYKDSDKYVNIVGQNTARTIDKQNFFYRNDEIALDLLKLPAYSIDMGIYTVYRSMGNNRDNPGHHNLDEVISSLRRYTEDNPTLHEKFANCYSFNDYLIRNGFYKVNENNQKTADTMKWILYQRNAMVNYQAKLESDAKGHIEDLFIGGR